jgi:very-short-patch-repair endonuclease
MYQVGRSEMSRYSVGRYIAKQIIKEDRQRSTGRRIQKEAAARPESKRVETPFGAFWMSPIEVDLYDAMRKEGLSPNPQFRIEAYYVDFAFPDIKLAIEADGAAYHSDDRKERDRKRDGFLWSRGWTVKRFYGATIHNKAGNCAFVIKREVQSLRKAMEEEERQREAERKARNEAIARPFKKIAQLVRHK